jgi:hypothetical protein
MFEVQVPTVTETPDHFRFHSPEEGERFQGLIAGAIVCVKTHFMEFTKPCLKVMAEGNLECRGCKAEFRLDDTCYLPLYIQPMERIVVKVSKKQFREIQTWQLHRLIEIYRPRGQKKGLKASLVKGSNYSVQWPGISSLCLDIRPWLVGLWKVPGLKEYLEHKGGIVPPEVIDRAPKPPPEREPTPEDREATRKLLDQWKERTSNPLNPLPEPEQPVPRARKRSTLNGTGSANGQQ